MKKKSPLQRTQCDEEVKEIFKKYSHRRCTCAKRRIYCTEVTGKTLNNYLICRRDSTTDPNHFSNRKKYRICSNLNDTIKRSESKEEEKDTPLLCNSSACSVATSRKNLPPSTDNSDNIVQPNIEMSRSQRLFMRKRIPATDCTLKGVKKVIVSVDEEKYEIDLRNRMKSTSKTENFKDDVLRTYYKLPFGKICMNERRRRMRKVGKEILSACVDRKKFRENTDEYLTKNEDLALQIVNLLDGVKDYIQSKLKVNLNKLADVALAPIESDREGTITELDMRNKSHKLALQLLGETTASGYARIRRSLHEYTKLPSYYKLAAERPAIAPIEIHAANVFDDDAPAELDFFEMNQFDAPQENIDVEEALRMFSESTDVMEGAKLVGDYGSYVGLMEDYHESNGRLIGHNDDDSENAVLVIDSIDGAEHLKSKKNVTSVISFSSTLVCPSWINEGKATAGSSSNILTWQQLRGKESVRTMLPAVRSYFEEKRVVRNSTERNRYSFYDLHDGKMLYLLTQHAQWSRKQNPFLLCKCSKGQGVSANRNHVCTKIPHEEEITLYDRSKQRWDGKRRRDPKYTLKKHLDWIDSSNHGVSHFGLHPDLLPRHGIRFDTFHMKCAITRKLMGYLRKFLLNQSTDVIDDFLKVVLKNFWKDFHLFVWKNKKDFSSFVGNELALFVGNTTRVVKFLSDNFEDNNEQVNDIKEGLKLWLKIFKFLGISVIQNRDEYKNEMKDFEENVKKFYDSGSRTFLSSVGSTDGKDETFYSHALRFYMIDITKVTFEKHGLGVGIFNMQGFERRNKESKEVMRKHGNNKGNILVSNMGRLWDKFERDNFTK